MKMKGKRHRPGAAAGDKPGKRGRTAEADESPAKAAKRKLRPSRVYGDADEFRRPLKLGVKRPRTAFQPAAQHAEPIPKEVGPIVLTGPTTVGEFAQKLSISPADLIKRAFLKGHAITINRLMDYTLAEEIAFDMDVDVHIELEGDESDIAEFQIEDAPEKLKPRPPVVTIMGHVDHGKTTILDYYRRSRVVEGEFGGITQHIGAYHVKTRRGEIVFLDTPGHEAFTAMRARGVLCTDIVVLVVSADDGVMPQTIEAIHHAQAAHVPIIVAVNKIDLPQSRPERVRNELLQFNLVGTPMGGDTEFVDISAKKGTHMEELLEIISLQAEVLELKADPDRHAGGVVIESHVDPLRGAVATILVRKGTLNIGDYFLVGRQSGRVRAMFDDLGKPVQSGGPSHPVELIGLSGAPEVGEIFIVLDSEQKAREIAERREHRRRMLDLGTTRHVTMAGLHDMIAEGKVKELNVILRADVQGSVEAIRQSLEKRSGEQTRVNVIHSGTGSINESDVSLAMASRAIIIGFNIRPDATAEATAAHEGIEIKLYRIIYELLDDIDKALLGMLEKKYKEVTVGRSEVREVFPISKVGKIAGCMVVMGELQRGAKCRLVRDSAVVYEGRIASLRRIKDDVGKVAQGYECGIGLENFQDIKQGDLIETFVMEEIPQELTRTAG
jgi:translation initiation factor IF-2